MERVLCIYALLVSVSSDPSKSDAELSEITDTVKGSLEAAIQDRKGAVAPHGAAYVWIDQPSDPELNIYTCSICGKIGTDWTKADRIYGVPEGVCEQGNFICDVCRDERSIIGEE
jgi:hypothetical protein